MRAGELHQGPSANRVPKWPLVSAGTDTVIPYYFLIGRCTQFSTDMESWVCRHSGTSPGSPWQVMEQLWARGRRVQGRRAGGRRARVGTASGGSEVRLPGMPVPAYGHCLPQPVFLAVGGAVGGSPWPSCRTSPPPPASRAKPLRVYLSASPAPGPNPSPLGLLPPQSILFINLLAEWTTWVARACQHGLQNQPH